MVDEAKLESIPYLIVYNNNRTLFQFKISSENLFSEDKECLTFLCPQCVKKVFNEKTDTQCAPECAVYALSNCYRQQRRGRLRGENHLSTQKEIRKARTITDQFHCSRRFQHPVKFAPV